MQTLRPRRLERRRRRDRLRSGLAAGQDQPQEHQARPGELERGDPRPLTGDTVFEIGSVTKVKRRSDVKLSPAGAKYRYYLVWITNLNGIDQVAINELALYK